MKCLIRHSGMVLACIIGVAGWVGLSGMNAPAEAGPPPLQATIIDRQGNRFDVDRLQYNNRRDIIYYLDGQRRVVSLAAIERLRFIGARNDEQQTLIVTFRSGRVEEGRITVGRSSPHQDAIGLGGTSPRFSGATALGPFFILANDVSEVLLADTNVIEEDVSLDATVITVDGQRHDVTNLTYRGGHRLRYETGSRRRFADLVKVAMIDFHESMATGGQMPVTIKFWSGRPPIQGTVDADQVRLSGETDQSHYDRVYASWRGRMDNRVLTLGTHQLRQIRFQEADEDDEDEEGDDDGNDAGGKPDGKDMEAEHGWEDVDRTL